MKTKRIISLFLVTICLLSTMTIMAASPVSKIENRLNEISSTGLYRTGSKNNAGKCWKFLTSVSNQLFGVDIPATTNGGKGNPYWDCIGVAYSKEDVKALFKKAQPGDIYQVNGAALHTAMFYQVDNSGFKWYHSTGSPYQTVSIDSKTWNSSFFDQYDGSLRVEIYRCKNNVKSGSVDESVLFKWNVPYSEKDTAAYSVKTTSFEKLSDGTYTLYGTAVSSGVPIKGVGMYIGTENSIKRMTKLGSDTGFSYSVKMYYNTGKFGYDLAPGTTYYYCAYAQINDKEVPAGNICSFTTPPGSDEKVEPEGEIAFTSSSLRLEPGAGGIINIITVPEGQKVELTSSDTSVATVKKYTIMGVGPGTAVVTATMKYGGKTYTDTIDVTVEPYKITELPQVTVKTAEAKDVTKTSATLCGQAEASEGMTFEGCGMYLGTSQSNMTILGRDQGASKTNKVNFWYGTQKNGYALTPGTTYYYQAYAIAGGEAYWGSIKSFTTPAEEKADPTPPEKANTRTAIVSGTVGNLNINSRPASGYAIGMIPEGAKCTVYPDRTSGNWYWVEYNGMSGFAYSKYLKIQ